MKGGFGGCGCDCGCMLWTDEIDGGYVFGGDDMVHWNSSYTAALVDVGKDRDHGYRGHNDAHGNELANDDAGGGADDYGAHVCSGNVRSTSVDVAAAVVGGGGVSLSRSHDGSELQYD